MSSFKLALQVGFWFLAGMIVPRLLTPFLGEGMAFLSFYGFLAIFIIAVSIMGKIASKQGHRNSKILAPTNDIPKALQKLAAELQALGFKQVGVIKHKPMWGLLGTQIAYTFINPSRNIFAYAKTTDGAHVIFSSYFPDGFDVSTHYPIGIPSESEKIIRRVVKSSLQAALDFHMHHVKKQMAQHAKPKKFASIRELLDWEDQHQLAADSHKTANKLGRKIWVRVLAALIVFPLVGVMLLVPVMIYFILQGYSAPPIVFFILLGAVTFIAPIIGLVWAYRPLYKPETVEDRKKKEFA